MIEGERQVHEQLVCPALARVELLHDIVDVRDGRRDKKREDEGDDIVLVCPDVHVDGVEDSQERETPRDAVNDDPLPAREELVDDGAEKQKMNQ